MERQKYLSPAEAEETLHGICVNDPSLRENVVSIDGRLNPDSVLIVRVRNADTAAQIRTHLKEIKADPTSRVEIWRPQGTPHPDEGGRPGT